MRFEACLLVCQLGALRADSAPGAASQWFTGVDSDTSTVLSDFPFREYSPIQGRWLSPNPGVPSAQRRALGWEPAGLAAGNAAGGPGGNRGGTPPPRRDPADADPQIGIDIFHCPGCPQLWHNSQGAVDAAWYATLGIGPELAGASEGASSGARTAYSLGLAAYLDAEASAPGLLGQLWDLTTGAAPGAALAATWGGLGALAVKVGRTLADCPPWYSSCW